MRVTWFTLEMLVVRSIIKKNKFGETLILLLNLVLKIVIQFENKLLVIHLTQRIFSGKCKRTSNTM